MNITQTKIDTWTELIQSEEFQDVLEDIQINILARPNKKLNKHIFKLLVHLCRTVDKCKLSNESGKRIAELTKLLCSLLIEIPDDSNDNFVKVLFKIARNLILLNLYDDAAEICCYLQPGNLYTPQNGTWELLTKVLSLWHMLVNNMLLALTSESINAESYNNLKCVIKYEMKMTQIAHKNYTKHLLLIISTYLDKIALIDKESKIYHGDFCKYILECLAEVQLCLDEAEKYVIYYHILRIMCHTIHKTIDIANTGCTVNTFNELFGHLKTFLTVDKECRVCFQQFQSLCITFLVPVKNFTSDSVKAVQNVICCNLNIAQKYGYTGCLKWNALSIDEIVEPVFAYWETCLAADKSVLVQLHETGILQETMNLFVHTNIDEYYDTQVSKECKWCSGEICTIKKDLYNAVLVKCKFISLLCKSFIKDLPEKMPILECAKKILKQNVQSVVNEIRVCKCKRWIQLWNVCYSLVYNMGILSEYVYEESIHLFSLLFTCIFQGTESDSIYLNNFKNLHSFSLGLHQLSLVHYNNGMYREAMTVCALNALLSYNQSDTKAFFMWAKIKKYVTEEIAKLTILECLRNDEEKIKNELGFSIDISKYDLIKLCSLEARHLLQTKIAFANGASAALDELKKLKPSNCQYANVIQLLGYYLLSFKHDSSVLKYHEQAISDLKQDKSSSMAVLCLEANLNFFTFVEQLHAMNKQTHIEMDKAQFALCAPKLLEYKETKSPNVVPAYTMINVKKDSSLMLNLQKCLKKWNRLFKCDINEIVEKWEPNLMLQMLITAAEYARLYRYEDCEVEAWTLAYRLASKINDYCKIIYVTGRCISLRQINYDWIAVAKEHAMKHQSSKDENVIHAIAIFWISLADLYFECGKCDDAKRLLIEARNLSEISFLASTSIYLLSLDVIIRHSNLYQDNMTQEEYGLYIVESLFAMRSMNQRLLTEKWKSQAEHLFGCDVIFSTTVNLSMRVNNLLSFRGISLDLVRYLKTAQSLGAIMRTAELLKALCYIDLSRSQLDDCEVKLQGLEHILDIETFHLSMQSKPIQVLPANVALTPTRIVDPVRDVSQHGSSPVLAQRVFDLPEFVLHVDCNCYKCGNASYQYLVFATTYIRAQLCVLQNQDNVALDHFHGAFKIRQKLFGEEESVLPENWPRDETGAKRFSWQARSYIADYVQLLIDFCYFLKTSVTSRQQDVLDTVHLAINVCRKYKLEGHPVYVSAKELKLDNDFQPILEISNYLNFMVPQSHDIDTSNYLEVSANPSVCVTPVQKPHVKKSFSVQRKGSPIWKGTVKVNRIWENDENDDSLSPPYLTRKSKSRAQLKVKRILMKELSDEDSAPEETKPRSRRTGNGNSTQKKSTKDVKVTLIPDVPQNLDLVDKLDVPAAMEDIDQLIEKVESLEVSSEMLKRKRAKDTKQLKITDYNKNVNQAQELLNNLAINEKTNENADLAPIKTETVNSFQDEISEKHKKKSIDTAGKQSTENGSESLTNKSKTTRTYSRLNTNNKDKDTKAETINSLQNKISGKYEKKLIDTAGKQSTESKSESLTEPKTTRKFFKYSRLNTNNEVKDTRMQSQKKVSRQTTKKTL